MQCAGAILSSVICLALHYFSTLSYKRHDFREKGGGVPEHKMCFDFLYSFCLKHLIPRITERYMIKNVCWSSRKVSVIPITILIKLEFSGQIFEKYTYHIS